MRCSACRHRSIGVMGEGRQADLAALLRARLAAAGLEPPSGDTSDLERDLALHLERVAALTAAADLHPSDPPLPNPTTATGPEGIGTGGVDNRGISAPGSATLPSGAPPPEGRVAPCPGCAMSR